MPTNDEIYDLLTKIDKKLDKTLNLVTRIGKTLHLIPVSEKEERDIQITQRKNLQLASKVNEDLNAMENKKDEPSQDIFEMFNSKESIYGDVLADDFLGKGE